MKAAARMAVVRVSKLAVPRADMKPPMPPPAPPPQLDDDDAAAAAEQAGRKYIRIASKLMEGEV